MPSAARYDQIVHDFCQRVGLQDTDRVAQGGTLDIEGVQLAFGLNEVVPQVPVVSIYVDVGIPSPSNEMTVLRVLLRQNFHNSASRGIAYCISPATGHVIGVLHVGLGGLEGQGLEALVNMLVDSSLELVKSGFCCPPPRCADGCAHGT